MPLQVQMLAKPFLTSYMGRFDELSDETIDSFADAIISRMEYIKHGVNDHGGDYYGCDEHN